MVGLQTLDLPIGVRVPASQPTDPISPFGILIVDASAAALWLTVRQNSGAQKGIALDLWWV